MIKTIVRTFVLSSLMLSISCREDLLVDNADRSNPIISEGIVNNGRLYFPNKESLQLTYDKFKDAEDEVIAGYIDEKDIISLRPIITQKNEKKIASKVAQRIQLLRLNKRFMASKSANAKIDSNDMIEEDIDDLEELVGDDAYGAFLNSDAEIQVANKIYKYTDVGLFIVDIQNYQLLEQYLEVKQISDNLLYPTSDNIKISYIQSLPAGEKISLGNNSSIEYFRGTNTYSGGFGNTGGSSGGSGQTGNTYSGGFESAGGTSSTQMLNFINNLQNCTTYNTWLQSLFGDSNMCVDRYEENRRVKTKAYNYNYYLVYNLGVKVKHQYKGWTGLWRKEKADEIRLGVIGATFYYDYSSYFNPPPASNRITTIYNNNNRYQFDANVFWMQDYLNPGLSSMKGFSTSGYPKIFQDNYYIEDIIPLNFSSSNPIVDKGIYSALKEGNRQLSYNYLNKMFWENVVKKVESFATSTGQPKPDNNITYSYNAVPLGKLLVQKTYYENKYNVNNVEKTFDWGFQIGFSIGDDGHVSPNASPSALKKPQEFKVLMYGIVKKNGKWHGSKINTIQ
ncbi:hypothetical protein [Chryseobacterium potabilaquae]|uniref:Uncharacterized protein n=1 Tax=Chryseobacterium potabilaquae TaxID=2675057 RepID=A0A6N4X676_9FLAO|nr:hypothetical protein [Chryseobacterium potabilaquae]CAA7195623.1 hypothetical protein CHRY9293_01796 [Chryseobacterium potabilaquae]